VRKAFGRIDSHMTKDAWLSLGLGLGLVLLSGCAARNGQQMVLPAQFPSSGSRESVSLETLTRIAHLVTHGVSPISARRDRGASWLAPSGGNLIYVSNFTSGRIEILSYPSGQQTGELKGLFGPNGGCTDGAGNVWITDTLDQQIVEYRVGDARRVAELSDPDEYPIDCSVDPTSGDLAVTNLFGSASPSLAAGNVVVYPGARGRPEGPYYDSVMYYMYFCHYDAAGNLFFDGESYGGQFRLAELPRSQSGIVDISLGLNIQQPGDIEPDGNNLALADQQAHVIYQVSVAGSQATVLGATPLQKTREIEQFALSDGSVAAAEGTGNHVGLWSYPAGGAPTDTIKKLSTPIGLVLVDAQRASGRARRSAAIRAVASPTARSRVATWMHPSTRSHDLLYVADSYNSVVDIYTYPEGKQVGALSGFNLPQGECSDANGNVFITNTNTSQIIEYAHGGTTPIAVLDDPHENPVGCAVDLKTGTLAVTNLTANGYGGSGSVALYKNARGTPRLYFDPDIYFMFFCGYDNKGNLFVDGQHFGGGGHGFQLAELLPHENTFRNIAMPVVVDFPGGVQWDGTDVAVGDQQADVIYRVHVTGLTASIDGTTPLSGGLDVVQFWKEGKVVIGPDALAGDAPLWRYPAGGSPFKTIGGLAGPEGATVSVAPGGPLAPTKGAKCSGPLRFLSDYNNGLVDVYRGTILCRVVYGFANPNGIAIDARGALYVTEKGNSTIAIVKPPYAEVTSTLSDSGQDPAGIAFCSGYIAVTNLETNQGGAGSVSIYLNGATSPSYILQDANVVGEYAPACDSGGNLYTSYRNAAGSGSVNEWTWGTGNPIELTAISTGFPGGLHYQKGNLWVGDQQTPTISVWPAPFDHSTKNIYLQGSDDPVDFIVDGSSHDLFVADALLNEGIIFTQQGQETATLPGNGGGLAVGITVRRN
jgi:sugar lactone lactonase YvrE